MEKEPIFTTVQEICDFYFDKIIKDVDVQDFDDLSTFHGHVLDLIDEKAPFLKEELNLMTYTKFIWDLRHNSEEFYDEYI